MDSSHPPSPQLQQPLQIGHYQVLDAIGRGGMGLVYRARDTRLEREVAIKCLRTELFEGHYIERFKREALLLAKLNHPNIVQIYDFIEAPEQLALVMELVDGQNLQTYLREHIAPLSQRLQWLAQIAEGLAIAHDAGIIHRDLKAENILINKRGQAKITDLGIAKSQDFNATLTDHVAGSYCSMSPEQAMGENISFKSDLFSLGILAYQLLCGAHPFGDTGNKLQIMQRIISHPPTAPQKYNPDLPAEFVDLLGQLLSKNPDNRPDNTHWVAAQFKKLSAMHVHDIMPSDDTQALPYTNINANTNTNTRNSNSAISRSAYTQDHPTFETHFAAAALPRVSLWQKIKTYIATNKIAVSSAALSILMIAVVMVWQLQPKPPKYIAVIPPKLTAEGMQESQQELVKAAVYNAIQQSVIHLDGYYLIPGNDIADINDDPKTIYQATAADELITTTIVCKTESCSIQLTRSSLIENNRLGILGSNTIDVLTDNYLSIAEITQRQVFSFYTQNTAIPLAASSEEDYTNFLNTNLEYQKNGASKTLLSALEQLAPRTRRLASVQTTYRDISLDLYYETNDAEYLEKLTAYLSLDNDATNTEKISHLLNIYHLNLAQNDFPALTQRITELEPLGVNDAKIIELKAVAALQKGDYAGAITLFNQALKIKKTVNFYFNLSLSYWYMGNIQSAKQHLEMAFALSPNHHKVHRMYGAISIYEGDLENTVTSFQKVLENRANDISALSNLGLAYLLGGKYGEAQKTFAQAKEFAPQNITLTLNLADAENLLGNKPRADELYAAVINDTAAGTQNPTNLRDRTQAYAHIGDFKAAITSLRELQHIDPHSVDTHYTSALTYTLSGDKTAALVYVDESLKNNLNFVWFAVDWFDLLCDQAEFVTLMSQYGNNNRCSAH